MILETHSLVFGRMGIALGSPLSLKLESGEAWHLQGPNGTGKSTLLRVLAGLVPPLDGTITRWDAFIYLGHQSPLPEDLAVGTHLVQQARLRPLSRRSVLEALKRLALEPYAGWPIKTLSAGQRRRVALAGIWGSDKKLWLLDEPTAGFDDRHRTLFDELVQEHLTQGGTVLFASHQVHTIPGLKKLVLNP